MAMLNEETNKIDYPPNFRRSTIGLPAIIHHATCRCPVDTKELLGLHANIASIDEFFGDKKENESEE